MIEQRTTWRGAIAALTRGSRPVDLVITHWGYRLARTVDDRPCAVAERLLFEMHRQNLQAPVIVFTSLAYADKNKVKALRAGALAYTYRWSTLFEEMSRLFERGSRRG